MGTPLNAIGREALEVIQCLPGAFPRESIKGPEYKHIELALAGFPEHPLELNAIRIPSAVLIFIFLNDCPTLRVAELPELSPLVIDVLTSVAG